MQQSSVYAEEEAELENAVAAVDELELAERIAMLAEDLETRYGPVDDVLA